MADIRLQQERLFRRTPGVHFSDVYIPGQNGLDWVEHKGFAISPPNEQFLGAKQFYIHRHQIDNNRVIKGARVFELVDVGNNWRHPYYYVLLDEHAGALEIPTNVYHRSVSCSTGSVLLNHAIRDDDFDEKEEFNPVCVTDDPVLSDVLRHTLPQYVNGTHDDIEEFIRTGNVTRV